MVEGKGGLGAPTRDAYDLGPYESAVRARLERWTVEKAAERIRAKDYTFWSPDPVPELTDRLGWLDLPETMQPETEALKAFISDVRREGFKHIVLLGMGGSSLAPEIYQAVFGNRTGHPTLLVLDSTHPDAIRAIEDSIDPDATLFIVASKSGTTVESLSLYRHFYHALTATEDQAGSHFVAITDPETPLVRLADERGFRKVFRALSDVGGRYSALTHFGLVPASLIGMDITDYLKRAGRMAVRCAVSDAGGTNPGLLLGATLGELALAGRDKVTFATSPSLAAFPRWLEQLIAESTGKEGKGIVPVVEEPLAGPQVYGEDRLFVHMSLRGEHDSETGDLLRTLASEGHPVLGFELTDKRDLAGEMFRWEMGVAAAGAVLGIHPFNQPDVQQAKTLAKQAMSGEASGDGEETDTVPADAGERLTRALKETLARVKQGDYLALQAYIAPSSVYGRALQGIRTSLRNRFHAATTLGFGPRFLHSTGQLHKGGPNTGVFIQLVDRPAQDLEVPETDFTFGRLIAAQALGDYQALTRRRRRLVRIDLGPDAQKGLQTLKTAIESAT